MLLFSSRANQISTNVKTNQTANRIAVMTRFLRQYSWCLADSSNQASPSRKGTTTRVSTRLLLPDAYTKLTARQIDRALPQRTKSRKGKTGDGGESGIRTHEALLTLTRFPSVRLKPLGHLSATAQILSRALAAVREPGAVVDADDSERYVAVHVLGRADLLLSATGALVQRHLDLQLERRQIFVLQLVREYLPALGLGSKFLAALAAQVLLENHPFFFAGSDLRFTRADLLDQPQHEVAVNRQTVILRASEHRHLERGKLERPVLPGNRRQRLQLAGARTSRATRDLQCHDHLLFPSVRL